MKANQPPIVYTQAYPCSSKKIWEAITEHDQMIKWYFENLPAFEPKKGFSVQFPVQSEERVFTHCWEVTEVVSDKKITYSWQFKEYPGKGLVTFDIKEGLTPNESQLTLTNEILADFPDNVPEFTRESCYAGWEYFLGQQLLQYLKG